MKIEIHFTLETLTLISENQAEKHYLNHIVKDLIYANFKHEHGTGVNQSSLTIPLYTEYKKP